MATVGNSEQGSLKTVIDEVAALARADFAAAVELASASAQKHGAQRDATSDLLHAAADFGLIGAFLEAATGYVTTKTRPWPGTGYARAADDPHVVARFGRFIAAHHALEELLREAAQEIAAGSHEAGELAAAARGQAIHVARGFVSGTLELLGASATSGKHGFDAYWRHLSAHARSHPPLGRPTSPAGSGDSTPIHSLG